MHTLTLVEVMQGQLHRAAEICREALQLTSAPSARLLPLAGLARIGLGEVLRQQNDLDAAAGYLVEGIELGKPWRNPQILVDGHIALAWVKQAQGDPAGALRMIGQAEQYGRELNVLPWTIGQVAANQARLRLAQGDVDAVVCWAQACGLSVDDGLSYLKEVEHFTLVRVLIAQGRDNQDGRALSDSLRLLDRLSQAAEASTRLGSVLESLVLRALALQAQGDLTAALTALARALSLAGPQGYVRLFADEGAPMAMLLGEAAAQGIAPDYAGRLLAAFGGVTKGEGRTTNGANSSSDVRRLPMVEPLTDRERAVLRLLPSELSGRGIARMLVVELSTVKTHLKSIYRKLDVHSRDQAIARARELQLQ
jgi:LuxR family maltose regulon positive regulatory protein